MTEFSKRSASRRPAAGARRFVFGTAELDERLRLLRVGGVSVAIDRKPLDVLMHLLEHPGELLGKEALAAACWPGRIISDTVLAKTVSRLREALGDRDQEIIQTVHGEGYRLAVPVAVRNSRDADEAAADAQAPLSSAEQRQLSVLSCGPVGAHAAAIAQVVARFEGHVSFGGDDTALAWFGFPVAHDDDAERAVHCGRQLIAGFALGAGIDTGPAVLNRGSEQPSIEPGPATLVAAQLQRRARTGSLLVSAATLKLVPGLFVTRRNGSVTRTAGGGEIAVHRVIDDSGRRTRLQAAAQLSPLVGRETELALLAERAAQADEGRGQAVLISAEPGLGKSRLLLALRERGAAVDHRWLECRASPLTRNIAYQPVIELLLAALEIGEEAPAPLRLQRLEQALQVADLELTETVPLLAPLLGLPLAAPYAPSPYGADLKRRKTVDALATWVGALARRELVVTVFEDMHWADQATLELVDRLVELAAARRLLVLVTGRVEFQPDWPVRTHLAVLPLPPLRSAQVAQMLEHLCGDALSATLRQQVVERANGVPLFVEEVARHLQERAANGADALAAAALDVPATLHDSLMARLDRLGAAKNLAQICAVCGRDVPLRLLRQVVDGDEAALLRRLSPLQRSGLLMEVGAPGPATYRFRHALIQDAAYNSLLPATRAALHGAVALALETHFPERAQAEPALLAQHFELAGELARALEYYRRAAIASASRAAVGDVLHHAGHAIELLTRLPPSPQRDQEELALGLVRIHWLNYAGGYVSRELEQAVARAAELLRVVQDPAGHAAALAHLYTLHHFSGKLDAAISYADQLLTFGRRASQPLIQATAHAASAASDYLRGNFGAAANSAAEALRLCPPAMGKANAALVGFDPGVTALLVETYAGWCLGYPDRALEAARRCASRAAEVGLPHVRCVAESFGVPAAHRYRREGRALLDSSRAALEFCERYGHADGIARAQKNLAVAHGLLGDPAQAISQLSMVMDRQRRAGALAAFSWDCGQVAEFCMAIGRLADAQAALDEGFAIAAQCNERFWEPELYRLQGELSLIESASPAAARAWFDKAVASAQERGARALELRASTSLARLLQHQDRAAARGVIAPVLQGFGEGHDTPDLQAAQELLDTL